MEPKPMTDGELAATVTRILLESTRLPVTRDALRTDARLVEDYGVDSMSLVDLMLNIEKAFGFAITEHDLESVPFDTADSLVSFVKTRLSGGAA